MNIKCEDTTPGDKEVKERQRIDLISLCKAVKKGILSEEKAILKNKGV